VKWIDTNFRRPKTGDKPLKVMFRNGLESRFEYTAAQLVWADRGWDFDVVKVRRV
jgi:hypothetical protein